ncbi:hypothetical protein QTP88_011501 [Uroleucon formosanum]
MENQHIKSRSENFINETLEFLVDTGSSVNIIRLSELTSDTKLVPGEKISLRGISNTIETTIGIVEIPIEIGTRIFKKVKFYIVKNEMPLIKAGILGRPFFQLQNTTINMPYGCGTHTLTLGSHIRIPPRVEYIMAVGVDTESIKDNEVITIHQGELQEQVFIGNVINTVKDRHVLVNIINISDEEKIIQPVSLSQIKYEVYREETVMHINHYKNKNLINYPERIKQLKKELRTEHLNSEERDSIERVCIDFMDIFHLEGDKLTHTTSIEHEIKTPEGEPPIYQRQYRLPHRQRDEITRQIKQMKSDGIIEPSNSPWNSPILLVPKKMDVSGKPKFRLVVDFRKLNNITVGDKMPLPQIQDVLDRLGRSKYFSVLDLAQGFHQISLDKESRVKTAFSSDIGHWQYTKLPMGLKNSPPTFQRLMNNVLCNLIGLKCLVYLDDIIVFSTDLSEHDKRIREVFSRLRTHNLKLQPIKCEFLRKEVIYLGHKLTEKGVQPDERKIKSVKTFPIPTTVKEIKSFLGLTGYYRNFVPDYGKIAKPITNLLRKGIEFIWTSECQEAFEKLKIILCNEPLLQYPDFEKPFIITCDASNYAVGCVLSQSVIPADLPIAYASRTLNKAEINYSTTEKELVAIMFGVKQFRPYVYGQKFTIITDHKPLTWLFSVKDPGSRLLRWRIKLDEFDYEIQYKSGKTNLNADALSRIKEINLIETTTKYGTFLEQFNSKIIMNTRIKEINGQIANAPKDSIVVIDIPKDKIITNELIQTITREVDLTNINTIIGDIAYIEKDKLICLITKEKDSDVPTYESIYNTLIKLRQFCENNRINKLTIFKNEINYTKDKLNWAQVRVMYSNKKQNIKIMKYNLNKIPIEGNILIIDHGHISGNGKPYASKILESPTWLEICKIANDLIITTGTYFFKYLNDICVVHDLENIKICCLGMGVLSYVNKKIEIESPCYYNLDEKLKKYLGFQNRTFDFSLDINTSTMYVPNSNEQYINIEKQCEFRLGRNGQIPLGTIFIGIYSINEIENVFNSFGAIYVANFPKIKFEIINGFLNVTASIGLCFDEYLSNCLGFDYIGNFKKLIPINKTWPRGKEIVLGVEYTEPDIAYTVIGIKKPNLYTNVFLKNFNGVIRSNKVKTLIKGNYSIDQLNSKLPPGIKLQNDKNCITLTSKTDFYMDQNFKLSLGIENMYFLYKHNGDILNNKSLLDVHCNIIEKSFSSINDKCHIEEDLLYNFYYNDDNPYIKTNPIKYIPVNGGFQEIKIDIINQDGKKYDFDDDNFIVYLDLIKE